MVFAFLLCFNAGWCEIIAFLFFHVLTSMTLQVLVCFAVAVSRTLSLLHSFSSEKYQMRFILTINHFYVRNEKFKSDSWRYREATRKYEKLYTNETVNINSFRLSLQPVSQSILLQKMDWWSGMARHGEQHLHVCIRAEILFSLSLFFLSFFGLSVLEKLFGDSRDVRCS